MPQKATKVHVTKSSKDRRCRHVINEQPEVRLRRCCVSFKAQTSSTPLVRFRHGPLKKGICDDASTATACDALLTHKLSETKSYRKNIYIFICVAGSVSETRSDAAGLTPVLKMQIRRRWTFNHNQKQKWLLCIGSCFNLLFKGAPHKIFFSLHVSVCGVPSDTFYCSVR